MSIACLPYAFKPFECSPLLDWRQPHHCLLEEHSMVLRFNPPPNWPKPPEGFTPGPGWSPDPSWGPAPTDWQLWVDDGIASPSNIPGNDPSSPSAFPSVAFGSSASAGASSPYAPGEVGTRPPRAHPIVLGRMLLLCPDAGAPVAPHTYEKSDATLVAQFLV